MKTRETLLEMKTRDSGADKKVVLCYRWTHGAMLQLKTQKAQLEMKTWSSIAPQKLRNTVTDGNTRGFDEDENTGINFMWNLDFFFLLHRTLD